VLQKRLEFSVNLLLMLEEDVSEPFVKPTFPWTSSMSSRTAISLLGFVLLASSPLHGVAQEPAAPLRWAYTGPAGTAIRLVALAPSSPSTIYAATYLGFVFRSTDGGGTWSVMNSEIVLGGLRALAVHPRNPEVLYVGTVRDSAFEQDPIGVFRSADGGKTWERAGGDRLNDVSITSLAIDHEFPQVVYAGTDHYTNGTVYRSVDDGNTWEDVAGVNETVSDLAIHPLDSKIVYAGRSGTGYIGDDQGTVLKTEDRGLHWRQVADRDNGFFIDQDPNDPPNFEEPQDAFVPAVTKIVADPFQLDTVYLSTYNGVIFKTQNGGQTWISVGQDFGCGASLTADPIVPDTLHCSGYHSTDGGLNWEEVSEAQLEDWGLQIDPRNGSIFYAANGGGGVVRSIDGGRTWIPVGLSGDTVGILTVQPSDPHVLLAGTNGGLYRSQDGGQSWRLLLPGGVNGDILHLLVHPADERIMYLAQEERHQNTVYPGRYYKSLDRGLTWTSIQNGLLYSRPDFMTVDPTNVNRVYVGSGDVAYQSRDGGASWQPLAALPESTWIASLLVDPKAPAILYANTEIGPFRSPNRGRTWSPIHQGLPDSGLSAWILMIDPSDSSVLYAHVDGDLYRATDAGQQWNLWYDWPDSGWRGLLRVGPPQASNFFTILASASGDSGQVFTSVDRGKTWTAIEPPLPPHRGVFELTLHPTRSGVAFVGTTYFSGLLVLQPTSTSGGPVPSLPASAGTAALLASAGILLRRRSAQRCEVRRT
jgi:photosystem II stability/assembly factor-like uncharacterized protein